MAVGVAPSYRDERGDQPAAAATSSLFPSHPRTGGISPAAVNPSCALSRPSPGHSQQHIIIIIIIINCHHLQGVS